VLWQGACHQSEVPAEYHPRYASPDTVRVEGRTFRDGRGRQLLFRGYNAKVNGIFDVTFEDGRKPNYTFPSFDEAGAQRFEELGFNVLRLTINWSALEPQPLQYSAAFFAKVEAVLDMAKRHHFYVILDMHQDAYSKEIGEDGAPLWAIVPPPPKLLEGPSDDSRRLSGPVTKAGFNFFDDVPATDGRPLQGAFVAAVQQMVKRWLGNPAVLGVEAFNEPVVLTTDKLDAFHDKLAEGLHAIDPDIPILFEPIGTRNQFDIAPMPDAPWSHGQGIYAPHIYTGWFSVPSQNGWESEDPAKLLPSMQHASDEAAAWDTPLFVTEFGCDQTVARGPKWLSAELDLQDRFLASSTAWAWEPGNWGIRDDVPVTGRTVTVRVVSRTFPRAVAGDLLAIERPEPGHLRVRYRATERTRGLPHEVSVSADYLKDVRFQCDGADVTAKTSVGRAEIVCPATAGEHTFDVVGTLLP
jgi:endoglycosylceramidase